MSSTLGSSAARVAARPRAPGLRGHVARSAHVRALWVTPASPTRRRSGGLLRRATLGKPFSLAQLLSRALDRLAVAVPAVQDRLQLEPDREGARAPS